MKTNLLTSLLTVGVAASVGHAAVYPAAASPGAQNVRTESGKVRCMVAPNGVVCQRESADGFPNGPVVYGSQSNQADVNTAGLLRWNSGNIPAVDGNDARFDTVLTYGRTFNFYGWTIAPSFDGTRFVNDQTGHGMDVSIDGVSAF